VGKKGGRIFTLVFFLIGVVFLVGSLDDLFIDLAHFLGGLSPSKVSGETWLLWRTRPEKPIAVMIPAWKESDVLEAMVVTNLKRIRYRNFRWFIGVYPNDEETLKIAKSLELLYPEKVTVVVTDRPGPTSKAHCLNCILNVIDGLAAIAKKEGKGWVPHYVAIHDAEDVIHPDSFTAISAQSPDMDFIQVPIFSLPVPVKSWVAGTYLDEFAEIHLKEIPVRQKLKMPIPSAGVGTFFSWPILSMMNRRFGYCFDEENLTEDYEISQRIARLGGKQAFLLIRDDKNEIVATREYFPDSLGRSVRQKTRWTTGIGLQTLSKWGRYGSHRSPVAPLRDFAAYYALLRDRKALWANPAAFLAWASLVVFIFYRSSSPAFQTVVKSPLWVWMNLLFFANSALFGVRLLQRLRFTRSVYGKAHGLMAIPRVIPSNLINGAASLSAIKGYLTAAAKGEKAKIIWAKTEHKFPDMEQLEEISSTQKTGTGR
jgi:adsorption protein B